jgi:SAM-dependent methyltransferase
MTECEKERRKLNAQQDHWEKIYSEESEFFGDNPSFAAKKALEMFRSEDKSVVLELGAGQGRDALFLAGQGFKVTAVDYSESAVEAIRHKAEKRGLSQSITVICHDIRKPLPFADGSFDACYCHMLYCMALCTHELEALFKEVRRVLKPNGLNIYTVRHTGDVHYQRGIPRGEAMYEMRGFIVHFFSREKVNRLAQGYQVVSVDEFEEGELPRKLFLVVLRKT